ncbi:MAG: hypothetical protein AAGG44_09945 [Planctomycetota bacterium]
MLPLFALDCAVEEIERRLKPRGRKPVKTVAQLLKEGGEPPAEVALDWAWQLHEWSQSTPTDAASPIALTWEKIQVGEDGLLRIDEAIQNSQSESSDQGSATKEESSPCGSREVEPLIFAAMRWANATDGLEIRSENADEWELANTELLAVSLSEATARLANGSPDSAPAHANAKSSVSLGGNRSASRSSKRRAGPQRADGGKSKQRFLMAASFLVGVCVLAVLWPVLFGGDSPVEDFANSSVVLSAADRTNPRGSNDEDALLSSSATNQQFPSTSPGTEMSGVSDGAAAAKEITVIEKLPAEALAAESPSAPENSPLNELSLFGQAFTIGSLSGTESNAAEMKDDVFETGKAENDANTAAGEVDGNPQQSVADEMSAELVLGADQSSAEEAAESAELAVNATLADMAKTAERDAPETEVQPIADAGIKQDQYPDPLRVATFPMIQWQKMPVRGRVREPEWQIRLSVTEGFVVRPATAQTARPREPVRWYVQEEEAEKGDTQLVVIAQVSGSRGDRLRWFIAAGSEDLPTTALPVGQRYLDLLQTNLLHYQQQLRIAVEGHKQLATIDDLPGQAKSMLRMRRKNFEAKLEATENVRKLASDANRMEGWLDGQIEVHARLVDSRAAGSPTVLQFGSVDTETESVASASEPAQEAASKEK